MALADPFINDQDFQLYVGDVREVLRELPADSVDCVVTSPPYWGLRSYGTDPQWWGDWHGELGLEPTPQLYVAHMVDVFREVRRVLAPHGTCWLNIGDSYIGGGRGGKTGDQLNEGTISRSHHDAGVRWGQPTGKVPGLKPKDRALVPERLAIALQDDGWWVRDQIVWSKPNPMPSSVTDRTTTSHETVWLLTKRGRYFFDGVAIAEPAKFYGPNGMPKDGPHAGQMRGRAGAKWSERKAAGATRGNVAFDGNVGAGTQRGVHGEGLSHDLGNGLTRNARSVWEIATVAYADAHFATFPPELVRRCVKAGTSERGYCPECGSPWERIVAASGGTTGRDWNSRRDNGTDDLAYGTTARREATDGTYRRRSTGWRPTCNCYDELYHRDFPKPRGRWQRMTWWSRVRSRAVPARFGWPTRAAVVLDPFMGSGTTAQVAREHGRHAVGVELKREYAEQIARRTHQLSLLA